MGSLTPTKKALLTSIFISPLLISIASANNSESISPVLSRIVLSTGGVGYYEFTAELEDTQSIELGIRVDQVDDVLKSLVIQDKKGNWVDVTLPGQSPKSSFFKTVPFDEDALSRLPELLSHLRGEEIDVRGNENIRGKIINVVAETGIHPKTGAQLNQNRVYLATEEGVASFILEQTDHIKFASEKLQQQFNDVLSRLADYRKNDFRKVHIVSHGKGKRQVTLGYVTAAPIWKTSYRLNIPAKTDSLKKDQTAWLQGWAILENDTAQDWQNIQLTLASGQPVTFQQKLYESYYIQRPHRPVPVPRQASPRRDDGAIALAESGGYNASAAQPEMLAMEMDHMALDAAPMAARSAPSLKSKGFAGQQRQLSRPALRHLPKVEQQDSPHVFFTFPQKLNVKAGHSIMIPIMNADLPAETRVLYQEDRNNNHPFATVTLKNNTESNLPAGALTLYDNPTGSATGGYIGDAELSPFPKGDQRLIPFAVDTQTRIDQEQKQSRRLVSMVYADGILRTKTKMILEKIYTIKTPEQEDRMVILEVPRMQGWELAEAPSDKIEITDGFYRIPIKAEKNKTFTRSIRFSRILADRVEITDPSQNGLSRLRAYLQNTEKTPAIKNYLSEIAKLQSQESKIVQQLSRIEGNIDRIYRDQERVQDNLSAVSSDSDLSRRYRKKLAQQEDQLEKLLSDQEKLQTQREMVYEKTVALLQKIKI